MNHAEQLERVKDYLLLYNSVLCFEDVEEWEETDRERIHGLLPSSRYSSDLECYRGSNLLLSPWNCSGNKVPAPQQICAVTPGSLQMQHCRETYSFDSGKALAQASQRDCHGCPIPGSVQCLVEWGLSILI